MQFETEISSYESLTLDPVPQLDQKNIESFFKGYDGKIGFSNYVECFCHYDDVVILSLLSGALVKFTIKDMQQDIGHIVEECLEQELLVDDRLGEFENAQTFLINLYNKQSFPSVTVAPTEFCNFGCVYCNQDAPQRGDTSALDENQYEEILSIVKSIGVRSLIIYGGEPLLKKNKHSLIKFLEALKCLDIEVGVITNGSQVSSFKKIFNDKLVRWCQITVDGPAYLHDKARPYKNGKGSWGHVWEGINTVLDTDVHLFLRVNAGEETFNECKSFVGSLEEEYKDKDKVSVYLAMITGTKFRPAVKELPEGYKNPELLTIINHIRGESPFYPKGNFCSTNGKGGSIVVTPKGIYNCWHHVGRSEKLKAAWGDWNNLDELLGAIHEEPRQLSHPCVECKYVFVCSGGCFDKQLPEKCDKERKTEEFRECLAKEIFCLLDTDG